MIQMRQNFIPNCWDLKEYLKFDEKMATV